MKSVVKRAELTTKGGEMTVRAKDSLKAFTPPGGLLTVKLKGRTSWWKRRKNVPELAGIHQQKGGEGK